MTVNPSLDTYVQVAADGAGKKVRNILVTVPSGDGTTTQTVYMQAVTVTDEDGFPLGDTTAALTQMVGLLFDIKQELLLLREALS